MERYLKLYNTVPEFSDIGRKEDLVVELMESYQSSIDVYEYDCSDEEMEEFEDKRLELEEFVNDMKYGIIYKLDDLIEGCEYRIVRTRDK